MLMSTAPSKASPLIYPESDGLPMAENTRQFRWIFTLAGNLGALYRDRDDVFVCGNQFWYPVEGELETRIAPDVYVVLGRPKGHRPSYRQWEEGNIPLTVVFEVLSPSNTIFEMADKQAFYDEHGVQEYYLYKPETNQLGGFERRGGVLAKIHQLNGFVSPRLGIRFDLSGPELVVRYPDGRPFVTFEELDAERVRAEQRAEQAEQRAARLAELSLKVLQQKATPEDLLELQRLLQPPPTSNP
jgi:Uma2 family endonuclease